MKHNLDQMNRFVELIRSDDDSSIQLWTPTLDNFNILDMETENEVKTDPEPQPNGEEKMDHAAENGEGANREATSVDQKPGTLNIYWDVNI